MINFVDYLVFRNREYYRYKNIKYYMDVYDGEQECSTYSLYRFLYE